MTVARTDLPATPRRAWVPALAGISGTMVYALSLTNVGMAVPHMQGAFSAAPDQIAWLFTGFVIGSTLFTACAGWFSERFGRRRVYLIAIVGFTVTSALGGAADTLGQAVALRALQGIFGGPLGALGQAISMDAYPRHRQGFAAAFWYMGAVCGTMLGPLTGGFLVEAFGWRSVFYITVPFGLASFLFCAAVVPATPRRPERRLDWLGFTTLSIAIAAFTLMLNRGERLDWFDSPEIILSGAIAAFVFYIFVAHTATARQPFVEPRLFIDRNYVIALLLALVYGGYVLLPVFLLPLLLKGVIGFPLALIGILLVPRGLGLIFALSLLGRLSDRLDPRLVLGFGFACLIISAWGMSAWNHDIGWWEVAWPVFVQGMGAGVTYVPISIIAFSTLPNRLRTEGMSILHLTSNLGTAIGTAWVFNVLTRAIQTNHAILSAHITPFNELLRFSLPRQAWDLAERADLAALSVEIGRQAAMIAYNNTFFLCAAAGLVVLPLIAALRVRVSRDET